jgi:hypothetical protein
MSDRRVPVKALREVFNIPEVNVAIFSFLLNFPWEIWQVPFFRGMASMLHWKAIAMCTQATVGDAVIAIASFWGIAIVARTRRWILRPTWREIAGFVGFGVIITIVFESFATGILDRWEYVEAMPILPILGTGLLPLLQWIILPPLVVWFVWRQLT